MARSLALPSSGGRLAFWRTAQVLGVVVTVVLIIGLFLQPDLALGVLWNVLIPLLPLTFLITPALWRGMCPLATLNTLPNGLLGERVLPARVLPSVGLVGVVLLFVLVPARRFLFNEHGAALAIVILGVAVIALVLGALFGLKAGFCNAICPVLPVEKLYGQHPFVTLSNPHCTSCVLCTPKGCLDLVPTKAAIQAIGRSHRSPAWLITPYGIFAAAFPGFVLGYFMVTDSSVSMAPWIYLTVLLWAGSSYLLVAFIVWIQKARARRVLPFLAAAAVGFYYWFVAPSVASTLGFSEVGILLLRTMTLALVGVWLWRAMRRVFYPSQGAARVLPTPPPAPQPSRLP